MKQLLVALCVSIIVPACSHQPAVPSRSPVPITILHTNDVHGHAWASKQKDGQERGGYAAQKALVDKIRREVESKNGVLLILSAGDINTGVPESDLLLGEPDISSMNEIGYDAMVMGNHEFDHGLEKLHKQMQWAKFPFLSANVVWKESDDFLGKPYAIFERPQISIGVVGLTTGDLKTLIVPKYLKKVAVKDPIRVAKQFIPKLKGYGADIVVALTHLGFSSAGIPGNPAPGDVQLAETVSGIDIVVGGHSDTLLEKGTQIGNTVIVQAGHYGHHLGRLDLLWDPNTSKILRWNAKAIPIRGANGEDLKLKKSLADFKLKAGKFLSQPIGIAKVALDGKREHVRSRETNLGNLICDALRKATKTDIAFFNGGGIRASIKKGTIYVRDIYRVLPFGNTAVTGVITGKQLKQTLSSGITHRHTTGSFLQVSGLSYKFSGSKLLELKINKRTVKDSDRFTFATNNFLINGGDRFEVLKTTTQQRDTGIPMDRLIRDYIRAKRHIRLKTEQRIQVVGMRATFKAAM